MATTEKGILPADKRVLTVAEVATLLHSSTHFVHELRHRGLLRPVPHTNRPVLFSRRAVEDFIEAQPVPAEAAS